MRDAGIKFRAIKEMFEISKNRESIFDYKFSCSFITLYCERMMDSLVSWDDYGKTPYVAFHVLSRS